MPSKVIRFLIQLTTLSDTAEGKVQYCYQVSKLDSAAIVRKLGKPVQRNNEYCHTISFL